MFHRLKKAGAALILAGAPLASFIAPGIVHAAGTDTWTGGGGDGLFSTAANWDNGVPSSGDDLVFNNTSGSTLTVTDDLVGVALGSVTLGGGNAVMIAASNPITLNGNVTSTTGGSNLGSGESWISGEITLGANITTTNVDFGTTTSQSTGDGKTLHLNGMTLNFIVNNAGTGVANIDNDVTGSGTLSLDVGSATMFFNGANTYSGTTNVISSGNIDSLAGTNSAGLLGTSSIVVSSNATLSLSAVSSYTFTNPITFQQASQNNNLYGNQLIVWNATSGHQAVTVTIPSITLLGNARFGVNESAGAVTVNLAGITANGHCLQYGDVNNVSAANFTNGPTACVVAGTSTTSGTSAATSAPGTPDTGFAAVTAHPVVTLAAALAAAGLLVLLARRADVAHAYSKVVRR